VPEQDQQARLDRGKLQQRLVYRHAMGSPDGALEQGAHHLRPVGQRAPEVVVEDGEPHRREHVPRGSVANETLLAA
jgi:hypothetical protein